MRHLPHVRLHDRLHNHGGDRSGQPERGSVGESTSVRWELDEVVAVTPATMPVIHASLAADLVDSSRSGAAHSHAA